MAGHSQFKNIMHRKNAQDAKKAKVFNRILREIQIAGLNDPDPNTNPRLRSAMWAAKKANLSKDTIQRALQKRHEDQAMQEEMRYEGYGPGGVAIIVCAHTNNRCRTVSEIRHIFHKNGGTLGEPGSVAFLFRHLCWAFYPISEPSEALLERVVDLPIIDVIYEDNLLKIYGLSEHFQHIIDGMTALQQNRLCDHIDPHESGIGYVAEAYLTVDDEQAKQCVKMLDALEQQDDVMSVWHNGHIDM